MHIEQSDKIIGYVKVSVDAIIFHAWTPRAGTQYVVSYWDACSVDTHSQMIGLRVPTISEATKLIYTGILNADGFRPYIVGPAWLLCWLTDYAAVESLPDTNKFKIHHNASGLGQLAPIWFVE